jgi:predicted DNA binding CopG/RHH family protein
MMATINAFMENPHRNMQTISFYLSKPLLTAIKKQAKRAKMPYQRYIRQVLERDLRGD